jgi:hypothetical protein
MSLAVGQAKGKATLIYAGVNSSPKDTEKGKSEHFRVLGLEPGKGKGKSEKVYGNKITEISRTQLFSQVDANSYQRILRLSKPYPGQAQLGAVTTGLAKKPEIVIFDTTATSPPVTRGSLHFSEEKKEAVDVDIIQTGDKDFLFAYCDQHDVYVKKISPADDGSEPVERYVTPASRSGEPVTVPKFKAMRWLTKDFILMLTNIHSNGGVVLQVLRLPPNGEGHCRIVQSHRLPSSITKATGLAVTNLTPPLSPADPQGYTQFVFAVGHGGSISLFKMDVQFESNVYLSTKIKPFHTIKDVHPAPRVITDIAFSNFTPPTHPITAQTPPQYLKLASVSVSNTVVVHTLPLFPVPLSVKRGQSKTPRYVVALPSQAATFGIYTIVTCLVALLGAVFVQSILEIRGDVKPFLDAQSYLPLPLQEAFGKPYVFPSDYGRTTSTSTITSTVTVDAKVIPATSTVTVAPPSVEDVPNFFEKLKITDSEGVVVINGDLDGVKAKIHDEGDQEHGGKAWDDLEHGEKEKWRTHLKDAGHWVEDMGESLFKGVLFGELAGAVGQAVAGG